MHLPTALAEIWGDKRAVEVVHEYKSAFQGRPNVLRDLAVFCNVAAPIGGATEFERGVEEGKRRVFLHIARVCGLNPLDFVKIADGSSGLDP